MNFRTEIKPLLALRGMLQHSKPVLLIGSCFSDNMANRLLDSGFTVFANPLGTLYNPASIARAMDCMVNGTRANAGEIVEQDGLYHSFMAHSALSGWTADETVSNINNGLADGLRFVKSAGTVIITLGTAWIFKLKSSGEVVANCHKLPSELFIRQRLSLAETTTLLFKLTADIRSVAPQANIIFTVSPIRHLADGAHGNTLSKATLLLAIEEVVATGNDDKIAYYPAYELLLDDLRDYRFYAPDMKHPSEQAIDYIYEHFLQSMLVTDDLRAVKEFRAFHALATHRLISPHPEAAQKHLDDIERAAGRLISVHPYLKPIIQSTICRIQH